MRTQRTHTPQPPPRRPEPDGGRPAGRTDGAGALIVLLFLALLPLTGSAQSGVTTFGIQLKPVIPFPFFEPHTDFERPNITASLDLKGGLAFGMVVRTGITKSISLETGINQIVRRYDFAISNDTNGYSDASQLRYVGYEVPLLLMVYIRLGEKTWMNNALGASIDMYPSDATRVVKYGQAYLFRRNWAQMGLVGNIGVEYRTYKSGIFYLGATYHRPFNDMAQADVTWFDNSFRPYRMTRLLDGSYLTLDLRYFFHEDPAKSKRKKKETEGRRAPTEEEYRKRQQQKK